MTSEHRGSTAVGALRQAYLYARGLALLARSPTSRETFIALSEAVVAVRSNRDAVAFMLEDERVAELCRERYVGRRHSPEDLIKYPPGSLGHELAVAMRKHRFDPEFYRDFYGDAPPQFKTDEEYLRFRVRQMHDIVHVLTGFAMTEFPGELGMQAFNAAQTRRPFSVALVGFGLIRVVLDPRELPRTLHQVAKGLAMGYSARSILGHRFEDDWAKPVEEWRRQLGLVSEPSFEFSPPAPASRRAPGSSTEAQGGTHPC